MNTDVTLRDAMEEIARHSARRKQSEHRSGSNRPTGYDAVLVALTLVIVYPDASVTDVISDLKDLEDYFLAEFDKAPPF